ncbi:PREDICTED: B3 domain-containing protein At5g25470-like isoform X2 [Camelina sativa]|nr:PREDICTED: B3 domain-containing protein At5g25470-like isoform X2 [Camelina sativa]
MLPKGVIGKIQANVSKPCFWKSLSSGQNWKSKSMRIIPDEFVGSTPGDFEHSVVISVRWGNSWQLWLEREKDDLYMIEEDWDEFVDDNHLGPNDNLFFRHDDTMFLEVQIFKNNGDEIMDVPLEVEPETEPLHSNTQSSYKDTATAASASASVEFSANGGTNGRAKEGCADIKNPERYLLNPENPYFVKTLAKKIDVLYVPKPVIQMYGLKFGPHDSTMSYLLPNDKINGLTKFYADGKSVCFNGWAGLCRKYNLKAGDSVVCELERSGGLVTAVRVHFFNENMR